MDMMIPLDIKKAYDLMGMHIQSMSTKFNFKYPMDFSFIKLHPFDEEFADMVFRYKNQVFAILMDITYNEKHISLSESKKHDLINIAKQNNLIPCIFPITLKFKSTDNEHGHGVQLTELDIPDIEYYIANQDDWNLINAETSKCVNPLELSSDSQTEMSDYELYNFSVSVAIQVLEQKGFIIKTVSDMPEYYPQIILKNNAGQEFWCDIAYSTEHDTDKTDEYKKIFKEHLSKAVKNNVHFAEFMATHDGILFSLYIKNSSRTDTEHNYKYHTVVMPATE